MFETRHVICPTAQALASSQLQADYQLCWAGIEKHFDPTAR
jgi:homogentisate 1,2-dioxygenase